MKVKTKSKVLSLDQLVDDVLADPVTATRYPMLAANAVIRERVRKCLKVCGTFKNRDDLESESVLNLAGLYVQHYSGRDNYGKLRTDYLASIEKMSEEQLVAETDSKLWLSAYANNNTRSDYHWHVDVIHDEWAVRGKPERYGERYDVLAKSLA